jgi:predicted AAA+ superfamily ATPase
VTAGDAVTGPEKISISLLKGMDTHQAPLRNLSLNTKLLSTHVLLLGGIGTGKTNAMKHLIYQLRNRASQDDAFVIFDTKSGPNRMYLTTFIS